MRITNAGGRTVSTDLATAFGSFDAAILDTARLTTSIMETQQASVGIPPALAQRYMDSLAESLSKVVEGRRRMVDAHRALVVVKDGSNLAETDYGCWTVGESATIPTKSETV